MAIAETGAGPFEPRYVSTTIYDRTTRHFIDPNRYTSPGLAAALADHAVELEHEIPGSIEDVVVGVRALLAHLNGVDSAADLTLGDLTAEHVTGWESALRIEQARTGTNTAYNRFVTVRALLARIAGDDPDQVHSSLRDLLDHSTVTTLTYTPGTGGVPPFADDTLRKMIKAAMLDIFRGVRLARAGDTAELRAVSDDVLVCLHVLMALGTGEPPEVLRRIHLGDITAAVERTNRTHLTNDDQAAWLEEAVHRRASAYHVELTKARSHQMYMTPIVRRDRYACLALEASIVTTGPFRTADDCSTALWITPDGRHAIFERGRTLSAWLDRKGIDADKPFAFARLRKTVTSREAIDDPVTYFALARRHTTRTFYEHYSNSPALRAHAGGVLLNAVTETFDQAVQPTVITPETEQRLRDGDRPAGAHVDGDKLDALLEGQLEGPHAACADPFTSPFERPGHGCGASATGLCFTCPNAIITEAHLPALVRFATDLHPDRAGDLAGWEKTWGPLWRTITERILPLFDAGLVAAAGDAAADVYVDIGVRQDIASIRPRP